jgi:hypothetical protein
MSKYGVYSEEKARTLAKKRAKKYEKLFEEPHFSSIMTAVEAKKKDDFEAACGKAGLELEERKWLWGYLQHCDEAQWRPVKDVAAYTGW